MTYDIYDTCDKIHVNIKWYMLYDTWVRIHVNIKWYMLYDAWVRIHDTGYTIQDTCKCYMIHQIIYM